MAEEPREAVFTDLEADTGITEIESLCMNCEQQGTTRLLLTRIPFFRVSAALLSIKLTCKEIVLMAFTCPFCNYRSNEIQSASTINEKGCKCSVKVEGKEDLNRQIIKSDTATLSIPELQFEVQC